MNFQLLLTRVALTVPGEEEFLTEQQIMFMVIGAVLAFAAIGLLWAVLSVFKKVFGGSSQSESTADTVAGVSTGNGVPSVPAQNADAQLIAVLTAAVAAYMADENGTPADPSTFRVVSFKRVSSGRAWNSR